MSKFMIGGLRYVGRVKGVPSFVTVQPWLRRWLFGDAILAFVFCGAIFYRSTYAMRDANVRMHERQHIKQGERLGWVFFTALYTLMHVCKGYEHNPFEVDARRVERG